MPFFNFLRNFFSNRFLGVDIGNFSIKLVELSRGKNRPKLLVADEVIIPKSGKRSITDDEISKILLTLIDRNKIKTKKVIFSIENSFTNYAIITTPKFKNKEMSEYIKLNFENFLPVRFEDVYLEWNILESNEDNVKILLIAINKEIISRYKKIAQNTKLIFHSFEIEANSLINSLVNKEKKDKNVIILDVRMKNSSLSLAKNGNLFKSSSLNVSVDLFNEKLK